MATYQKDERIPLTQRELQSLKRGEEILYDGEPVKFQCIVECEHGCVLVELEDGSIEDVLLADLALPDYDLIEARGLSAPVTPVKRISAVEHLLRRIAKDPQLAWFFDPYTESMQLLTRDYCNEIDADLNAFREKYYSMLKFERPNGES